MTISHLLDPRWKDAKACPPKPGLYVALYRDGSSMPVALCYRDAEGNWTQDADSDADGDPHYYVHERDVIAYIDINLDLQGLCAMRMRLVQAAGVQP